MNYKRLATIYMTAVVIVGTACFAVAVAGISPEKIDLNFLLLFSITILIGSRITVKIPTLKSQVSVSDTFIFLALLLYGGEFAVPLAALEVMFSAMRFCNKKITVLLNFASMALSMTVVVLVLKMSGLYTAARLHGYPEHLQNFIIALSVIAITQFIISTALASLHDALKNETSWIETWKSNYIWTFLTYFIGAAAAGVLVELVNSIGFGVIFAAVPVMYFLFLTYRTYLENVANSLRQKEQAEEYAQVLEKQSAALRKSEERFRSAFSYAPIGIALVSSAGKWLKVNQALSEILGYTEEEFLKMDFQSVIFEEDLGGTLVKIHELISGKSVNCQMEQRYLHKSGKTVWVSWSVSTASDNRADLPNLIFQIQDITGKKLAEEKLLHEATHDALTGLANRQHFMCMLTEALKRGRQERDYRMSVLFIDLDRFKNVNDSLGHMIGDQLLTGIAERLRECVRPSDNVARLGGDEFTVLVQGYYDAKEVLRISERIQQKFGMKFDLSGHEVYSSASIGILHASDKHHTSEDIMRDADTAMYQAKRSGKARHEVFDENMHHIAKETFQLETDLRRALERDELNVHFQPIFSLSTGKIEGIEALARWNHRELGQIPPKKFIPLAEELGLIHTLGGQILRKACRQINSIRDAMGNAETPLILSVNLSPRRFASNTLVQTIRSILEDTGFPAHRLKLEITETVFVEYQDRAIEMLHQLHDLGIQIDIDDFGTGYSNLGHLLKLPISTLKIDQSFIRLIDEEGNTEIVQTILTMAKSLGMTVCAEGVETEAQFETLKRLECERAQGFLFARPMPIEELGLFLKENLGLAIPKVRWEEVSIATTVQ